MNNDDDIEFTSDYDDTIYSNEDSVICFEEYNFDDDIERYNIIIFIKNGNNTNYYSNKNVKRKLELYKNYKNEYLNKFINYGKQHSLLFYACYFIDFIIFCDETDKRFFGVIYKNEICFCNSLSLPIRFILNHRGIFSYNEAGCSCADCSQVMIDIYCRKCDIDPISRRRFIDEMKYLMCYTKSET